MIKLETIAQKIDKKVNFNKLLIAFIFLSNIALVIFYMFASHYNRLVHDDFWALILCREHGFWGGILELLKQASSRFGPYFLNAIIIKSYEYLKTLSHFTFLLIFGYVFAIFRFIKLILKPTSKDFFVVLNMSLLIFNIFLLSTYALYSFYFVTAACCYFFGILFAIIGFHEIISNSKSIISYLTLIFSFIYAGSSVESYTFIFTILLFSLLVFIAYKSKANNIMAYLKDSKVQKTMLSIGICILCFIIMLLLQGTLNRMSKIDNRNTFNILAISLKSLYTFLAYTQDKIKYFVIIILSFIYFGTHFRKENQVDNKFNLPLIYSLAIPLLLIVVFIGFIPVAYAVGGTGPDRSWTIFAFLITISFAFIGFVTGYQTRFPKNIALILTFICSVFYLFIPIYGISVNIPELKKYSISYDNRIEYIKKQKLNSNDTLYLDSLYVNSKVFFYDAEITNNKKDKSGRATATRFYTKALELNFEIKLKSNKQ